MKCCVCGTSVPFDEHETVVEALQEETKLLHVISIMQVFDDDDTRGADDDVVVCEKCLEAARENQERQS